MSSSGHFSLAIAAAFLFGPPARSQETDNWSSSVQGKAVGGTLLTEDSCEILTALKGGRPEMREAPGMHVLDRTRDSPLLLKSEPGVVIHGVVCWRSEAKLGPNDYLVPQQTGFSLYIKSIAENETNNRTIVLDKFNGTFRIRLLNGPKWSQTEKEEIERTIQLYAKRTASGG